MNGLDAQRDDVTRQLTRVIDPEIGSDIVTLGMIYGIQVDGGNVTITMTLTTRGCPMQAVLTGAVERVVNELPWVEQTTINLVWDPPWHPDMIQQ